MRTHLRSNLRERCPSRSGFTLLEVLVALLLTGIVTSGVALALQTGLDSAQRIRDRADVHAEGRGVVELLAADLEAAFLSGANQASTYFVAQPIEAVPPGEPFLRFTTLNYRRGPARIGAAGNGAAVPSQPRSDAVQVEYVLQPVGDPEAQVHALVRRERWLTESGPGVTEVVSERIRRMRVLFPGRDPAAEAPLPEWDAAPAEDPDLEAVEGREYVSPTERSLPSTVELVLVLAGSDDPREETQDRVYRTTVKLAVDSPPPFDTHVTPPPLAGSSPQGGTAAPPHR